MKHSSVVAFLNGDLSPDVFGSEISKEVDACQQAIKTGGVGYIIVTDGPVEVITREHARRLLRALASSQLSFLAANYTADCLIMSDDFSFADDAVADAIGFVADESRPPTQEEIQAAIVALS